MIEIPNVLQMADRKPNGDFSQVHREPGLKGDALDSTSITLGRPGRTKSAPVGVVGKVIRILELLGLAPGGLLLREISSRTKINKSTAHRFLAHLESAGYVFRDTEGHYMIGPGLAKLSSCPTKQAILSRASVEILERLRATTGETINLAVLDKAEVLYLSAFESPHTVRVVSELGMRKPIHSTAVGKAILAFLPSREQGRVFPTLQFERHTLQTIGSADELKTELLGVQRRGYAIDDEESARGVRCVAAPIFDRDRRVIGAISISGPVVRFDKSKLGILAFLLQRAAEEILLNLDRTTNENIER